MTGEQWGELLVILIKSAISRGLNYRYTFKTMGAGFYALQNSKDFRKTIIELVMEAGDADT